MSRPGAREHTDSLHECGHAVCAEVVGFPVLWLDLHTNKERRGYCAHDHPKPANHRAELVLIWGGWAGEIVGGFPVEIHSGLAGDVKRADELIRMIVGRRPGIGEASRLNERAIRTAIAILTAYADALHALARQLVRDNELSGPTVRKVMSFYPPAKRRQKRASSCHSSK